MFACRPRGGAASAARASTGLLVGLALLLTVMCAVPPSAPPGAQSSDAQGTRSTDAQGAPSAYNLAAPPPAVAEPAPDRFGLTFEPNVGQADPAVQFLARGTDSTLLLTSDEAVLRLRLLSSGTSSVHDRPPALPGSPDAPEIPSPPAAPAEPPAPPNPAAELRLRPVGAAPATWLGEDEQPGRVNYLRGNDPARWRTDVPTYGRARGPEVYPGVDLVYYGGAAGLEYDFVVAPGADPRPIAVALAGVTGLRLDDRGALVIAVGDRELRQPPPVAYQDSAAGREPVAARYVLPTDRPAGADAPGRILAFEIGPYDAGRPLVIDPVLSYSTYLGGTGADWARGVAVDGAGSAYLTGSTCSFDFPMHTPGQSSFGGGTTTDCGDQTGAGDIFVTKFNATASALVYSTYLGGSGDDVGWSIAVDGSGQAHIAGITNSTDYPATKFTYACGPTATHFITKLSAAGNALVYSQCGYGGLRVAVDSAGNAYTVGYFSPTWVYKFDSLGTVLYQFSIGPATGTTAGEGITVDSAGSAYIAGYTTGGLTPTSAFQPTFGGGTYDAFVAKLNVAGSALSYLSYLGGSGDDYANAVAVDTLGNAYVTGLTNSTNFPVLNAYQTTYGGGTTDAFVAKITPTGTAKVYSTYLGGSGNGGTTYADDVGEGIAVDLAGNAYVTGITSSANFRLQSPLQTTKHDLTLPDGFIVKYSPSGFVHYASYLGGCGFNQAYGQAIAVDSSGNAYVAGVATCGLPTTPGVFQPDYFGELDAFADKIVDPPINPVDLRITQSASPNPVTVGANLTYTLTVTNLSTLQATGVTVTDVLPAGVNLASATSAAGPCTHAASVTCALSQLAGGASATVTIVVQPTATGTKTNTVSVSADQPDPVIGNNTATANVTVNAGSASATPVQRVSINSDALYTNTANVYLYFAAPAGANGMEISNDNVTFTSPPQPIVSPTAWTLANTPHPTVYVKFFNGSTLLGTFSDDILLASTPPTGTIAVTARPSSTLLSVKLNAAAPAGVTRMRLSTDPTFSGVPFQPYFTSANLTLPPGFAPPPPAGAPRATTTSCCVYVQFQDNAGNLSDPGGGAKPPSLGVSPPQVAQGSSNLTATWSDVPDAYVSTNNWLAMFPVGADDRNSVADRFTTGTGNGNESFPVPTTASDGTAFPNGQYVLRLFAQKGVTRLAESAVFAVGPVQAVPSPTTPPAPTPTTPPAGPSPTTPPGGPSPTTPPSQCAPRPPVRVSVAPGSGYLQATVAASSNPGATANQLRSVQVTSTTNATVDVGSQTGLTGSFPIAVPNGASQVSFVVHRVAGGQASTVALSVGDACGTWPTFVGGGPTAW